MNSIFNNKKLGGIMLIISAIFFLWISTFGLVYHMNEMKAGVADNSCLFSISSNGECAMNLSEHITLWQEMITGLPQNIVGLINALILVILLAITIIFWQNSLSLFSRRISSRYRLYIKQHPQINLFNYLGEVFSSGILNTKIYETIKI